MQGSVRALKAAPKLQNYNSSQKYKQWYTKIHIHNAHLKKTYTHPNLTKGENDFKKVLLKNLPEKEKMSES